MTADGLAPAGARPSAVTDLTTKLHIFYIYCGYHRSQIPFVDQMRSFTVTEGSHEHFKPYKNTWWFNTLRPRQSERHLANDIFMCIFFNENCCILIKFSLKYVRKGPIDKNPALVQIMAWRRLGDKPLSEPMMVSLPTHICVTRPQWVNSLAPGRFQFNFR